MAFNDDEPIILVPIPNVSSGSSTLSKRERVKVTSRHQKEAPLEETKFKALVNVIGERFSSDRPGVDIVMVLDVSGSMSGDKLNKLKIAMQFLIKKLSSIDRLSLVKFSSVANRLCPLLQITNESLSSIENLVQGLTADGWTNITAGLQTALQVLNDRKFSVGRAAAIMLMSDGEQNEGGDARNVLVNHVPVYTFGFGDDYDPTVLNDIAKNSNGGTFSNVDINNLNVAFSQCLAGLLTVVVQELEVTIKPIEEQVNGQKINPPKIEKVYAGNYPQITDQASGSVTISFGDLYVREIRRIIVDLLLPAVDRPLVTKILQVSYRYRIKGNLVDSTPKIMSVIRSRIGRREEEPEELVMEEKRLETADSMKEARELADKQKLIDAREKLVDSRSKLQDVEVREEPNKQALGMLKAEVRKLSELMRNEDTYKKQGRPFALASETSHQRQRFASRGDDHDIRPFATPRMDTYLKQSKSFDDDPEKPPSTLEEDVQEEIAKDPLSTPRDDHQEALGRGKSWMAFCNTCPMRLFLAAFCMFICFIIVYIFVINY